MSASFRTAFHLTLLLSTLNIQILLATSVSQSNLQQISNQIDSSSTAQHLKSQHPLLSSYPIGSEYDIVGRYYDSASSTKPHPELELSHPIDQEKTHVPNSKSDILEKGEEEKRAFKFGKRVNTESDLTAGKRNKMAFKFGKRSEISETDDIDKRAFKFGKKSSLQPLDYDKRGGFKFGKRFSVQNFADSYEDQDEKRAFKFGKRFDEDDEVSKRMFKFGKRPHTGGYLNDEAILGDANTKDWEDVRGDSYSRLQALYDSSRPINQDERNFIPSLLPGVNPDDQTEDKRAFKFGKKSSLDDWREKMRQQEKYRQRNRQSDDGVDRRRLFKLGKRSEIDQYDHLSDEEIMKRQFKFGK